MNSIFLNGMGKSGNHFLYRLRDLLQPKGCLSITANHDERVWKVVCSKGTAGKDTWFIIGHYPWSKVNEATLRIRACKMILIIRDLRDVVVSYYRAFETENITIPIPFRKYFTVYDNKEEVIDDLILGGFKNMPEIDPGGFVSPKVFKEYFFSYMDTAQKFSCQHKYPEFFQRRNSYP